MKRLLLVAYHFPPEPAAGALRPGYLARYLAAYGWDVTVLTRPLGDPGFDCDVVCAGVASSAFEARVRASLDRKRHTPDSPLRAALRAAKETLLFPDRAAPWIAPALARALALTRERQFDAILSTAMPASVHVVAGLTARLRDIPWIADYRDPWAGNAYFSRGITRRALEHGLERALVRRAARITTISAPIAHVLGSFHRRNDVEVVPNAYDPAEWQPFEAVAPERFSLCYTGSMYDGMRRPDALFAGLARLRTQGDPAGGATIDFYGPNSESVVAVAARNGIADCVVQHGTVPRAAAMRAQRAASALLIFLSTDPKTSMEMGSKYLEYVGARRPIIAIGPSDSVMKPFLARYELGWFASSPEEAERAIRSAYERYCAEGAEVRVDADAVPTAKELAQRFARLLNDVTATRREPNADRPAQPYRLHR